MADVFLTSSINWEIVFQKILAAPFKKNKIPSEVIMRQKCLEMITE